MEMSEVLLTCLLSSTLAATVVTSIKELILWFLNRRAKVKDNKEEKNDEVSEILKKQSEKITRIYDKVDTLKDDVSNLKDQMQATVKHDKVILRDKIKYLISKYIEYGEITIEEKQAIQHMWNIYHFDLGGNGDLNDWMDMLEEIPVKSSVNGVLHYPHLKEGC